VSWAEGLAHSTARHDTVGTAQCQHDTVANYTPDHRAHRARGGRDDQPGKPATKWACELEIGPMMEPMGCALERSGDPSRLGKLVGSGRVENPIYLSKDFLLKLLC
jgi:hypothetical protein